MKRRCKWCNLENAIYIKYHDEEWGVETNVRHGGGMEEITGDYEAELLEIMKDWN